MNSTCFPKKRNHARFSIALILGSIGGLLAGSSSLAKIDPFVLDDEIKLRMAPEAVEPQHDLSYHRARRPVVVSVDLSASGVAAETDAEAVEVLSDFIARIRAVRQ